MENKNLRLALLIDGDNAQAALLPQMIERLNDYGLMTIRRAYGDLRSSQMNSWSEVKDAFSLKLVQVSSYTPGKNATDIVLIIDAMHILYTSDIDGICIVSSDSDYTPLAIHVREMGKVVIGVGREKTSPALKNACHMFITTESLQTVANIVVSEITKLVAPTPSTNMPLPLPAKDSGTTVVAQPMTNALKKMFRKVISETAQADGWTQLTAVGTVLKQLDPDFSPSKYGYSKLSLMIQAYPNLFEFEKRGTVNYARLKT